MCCALDAGSAGSGHPHRMGGHSGGVHATATVQGAAMRHSRWKPACNTDAVITDVHGAATPWPIGVSSADQRIRLDVWCGAERRYPLTGHAYRPATSPS